MPTLVPTIDEFLGIQRFLHLQEEEPSFFMESLLQELESIIPLRYENKSTDEIFALIKEMSEKIQEVFDNWRAFFAEDEEGEQGTLCIDLVNRYNGKTFCFTSKFNRPNHIQSEDLLRSCPSVKERELLMLKLITYEIEMWELVFRLINENPSLEQNLKCRPKLVINLLNR